MTRKNLFRRVVDAVVEGRTRQAERYVDEYIKSHRNPPPGRPPREG